MHVLSVKWDSRSRNRNMCGTFYWSFSGVVELRHRYAGEAGPEVQIADSCDSQSVAPTAADLWGKKAILFN